MNQDQDPENAVYEQFPSAFPHFVEKKPQENLMMGQNQTNPRSFLAHGSFGASELFKERVKEFYDQKEKHMAERSCRALIIFLLNCFVFIMARELPFDLHQFGRLHKNQKPLVYYEMLKYELIYWVPNMFLPLIFGFVCDYAANDLISNTFPKIIILTMIFPMILSQMVLVISNTGHDNIGEKIVSRFIFSFVGETFFIMLISSLSLWFKKNGQILKICLFIVVESLAFTFCNLIVGIVGKSYGDNFDVNGDIFLCLSRSFLIILGILWLINAFWYPESYKKTEHELYNEITQESRINKRSELCMNPDTEKVRAMSKENSKIQKQSFRKFKEELLPSSLWNVLTKQVLNFRLILLSVIHAIAVVCFYVFENVVMYFLFIDYPNWNKSDSDSIKASPLFSSEVYTNTAFAKMAVSFVKAIIPLTVMGHLKKYGNRNLLLYIAIVTFIYAFAILAIYFNTIQNIIVNPGKQVDPAVDPDFNSNLDYFIVGIVLGAVCLAFSFQQVSFFSYIPVLVDEKFYMTTYGFFSCVQSIFMVVFYCIIGQSFILNYGYEYLQFGDVSSVLGMLIIILVISLILIMILEYNDKDKRLYGIAPKQNYLEGIGLAKSIGLVPNPSC